MSKKVISLILVLLLIISLFPLSVFAENAQNIYALESNRYIGEKDNPIVSLEVPDVTIIENTNGTKTGGFFYYFKDIHNSDIKCIASYKDGEKKYDCANIDESDLKKQETNHWIAGNTYKLKVSYEGFENNVNVKIIKNPIKEIKIEDVFVYEGLNYYDENGHSEEWYSPRYKVTLNDGTVLSSKSSSAYENFVIIGGREYELKVDNNQIDFNSLEAGKSYKINCEISGIMTTYNLKVLKSPFKSLHIDDIEVKKSSSEQFYSYFPKSGTVELDSGEKVDLNNCGYGLDITLNGKTFNVDYDSGKQFDTPFEEEKVYSIEASLGKLKTTYNVKVLKSDNDNNIQVTNIELISNPDKTEYIIGECFDLRGAVIRLSFSDNSFEDIKVTELPDDYLCFYIFSKTLKEYFTVSFTVSNFYNIYFNSVSPKNVKLYAFNQEFECPVTVKENTWKDILVEDFFTLDPKLKFTDENGKSNTLKIEKLGFRGGSGGRSSWGVKSTEDDIVFFTEFGILYFDCFTWDNGENRYSNFYFNNKKLKSNTLNQDKYSSPENKIEIAYIPDSVSYEFSNIGSKKFFNNTFYVEKEFYYKDGSKKIAYMRFDKDFELLGYDFDVEKGNIDGDEKITDKDAIHLLMYSYFPEDYPVNQSCDFNDDGVISDKDAIYLLMYCYFPEDYPIK